MYNDLVFEVFVEHVKDLDLAQLVLPFVFKHVLKVSTHHKSQVLGYLLMHKELVDMEDLFLEDRGHSVGPPRDSFYGTNNVGENATCDKHTEDSIDLFVLGVRDYVSISHSGHGCESPVE